MNPTRTVTDTPNIQELALEEASWLERARRIAREGWGRVHPNPMVGCVLVRDGEVVGEGYHAEFGGPHGEIVALEAALSQAAGATAYVSLEPCDHHGKTPPCSQALIHAGIRRVVYGAADPGGESSGGADTLRAAGIDVVGPLWTTEASRAENPAFYHQARHGSPFIALKLAMSMDARIAAGAGERTRISGVDAEREVHRLRTGYDAVLVGAGTVRVDDPRLTVRMVAPGRVPPRRVLAVSDASLPEDAAVFADADQSPLHVFCSENASEAAIERLEARGAHVHPVPASGSGLDLDALLRRCWEMGIRSLLCEGGAKLAASLLGERRVNRLYLFVAPTTLGASGLPAFPDSADALRWDDFQPVGSAERFGRDTLIVLDRQEA